MLTGKERLEQMLSSRDILEKAGVLPPYMQVDERELIIELAREVPAGGLIVEVGALYGGSTAVLALANPAARIISVDDFSWSPVAGKPASKERLLLGLAAVGVTIEEVIEGDSREVGKDWTEPIDFLLIDGGHSFQYVHADLMNFGPHANVIAAHDYEDAKWKGEIQPAVADFIKAHPCWYIEKVVNTTVVLRKNGGEKGAKE